MGLRGGTGWPSGAPSEVVKVVTRPPDDAASAGGGGLRHQIELPDGRRVVAVSEADCRFAWEEIFEKESYREAAQLVRPGGAVIDVGAHLGLSSRYFLEHTPAGIILACEPASATFACLAENVADADRIRPLRVALGRAHATGRLTYYPDAPTQSGLYADPERDEEATVTYLERSGYQPREARFLAAGLHEGLSEEVEVLTLSELLARFALDRVDLLKIDVERSELDVLEGIAEPDWDRIGAVVLEIHDIDGHLERCRQLLDGHGLDVRSWQEEWLVGSELYTALAVRRHPLAGGRPLTGAEAGRPEEA